MSDSLIALFGMGFLIGVVVTLIVMGVLAWLN